MQQQENTTRLTSVTGVEIPAIRRAPTSTNVTSPSTTATHQQEMKDQYRKTSPVPYE